MPTKPTHSHPTASFQNYRANNKLLYNHYLNKLGHQNIENYNSLLQPTQNLALGYSSPIVSQLNNPPIQHLNLENYNNDNNIGSGIKEVTKPVSQCGRKLKDEMNNSGSNILYYYCNNRITNYKNPTQQQATVQAATTLEPTSSTTTTTTTTTETPLITTIKPSHNNVTHSTTERPIFLPTPNTPLENNFVPITSAVALKNSVTNLENREEFRLQRQKYRQKKYDQQQPTTLRYEDTKRQHQFTTAAAYDNMKFHSFFTLEDAVTRAPEMQVFNDPYQAYRHARQQQINHQRLTAPTTKISDITTTTSKPRFKNFFDDLYDEDYPEVFRQPKKSQQISRQRNSFKTTKIPDITSTFKPKFKSFFDDLNDDDYIIRDAHQYDYSLYNKPKTSAYPESEFENQEHNPITHQMHRGTEYSTTSSISEPAVGKPTIKEHNFDLFRTIFPTTHTSTDITTYKPKTELSSTTLNTPSRTSSYNSKSIAFTSTSGTVFGNQEIMTEKEQNKRKSLKEVRVTTSIPIFTTTEKKSTKLAFKSPLNLRSSTIFKYPNQRLLQKTKNTTSSITTKATNTLKKVPKYQRQYKTKKLKQFKHLYTTSTTTTTTTTTRDTPTTIESETKSISPRLLTTTSTTEEPTTKKTIFSRSLLTTETPKQIQVQTSATTKKRRVKPRNSTASTTTVYESSTRPPIKRRGSKRRTITNSGKDATEIKESKVNNKSRRRLNSSSSTTKPLSSRASSALTSTSTLIPVSTPATLRTSTSTTMKSIMRITNSKSRSKTHNDIRSSIKTFSDMNDRRISPKTTTSTMESIPPLPIEIYFKKSHNSKI